TDVGGLMAYGVSYPDLYFRSATFIDKIFRGAKAGDLPVEQPTKLELIINLAAAKALGLTVPPSLITRAAEILEGSPALRQETSRRVLASFDGMSISLHPDTPQGRTEARTLAPSPVADAAPAAAPSGAKTRSRLFTKYVALFVAVVAVALLSNGIFEVFFYY